MTKLVAGSRLDGKVAMITGGCSGMGLTTAHLFIKEGASVVIADIQDERGAQLADEFGSSCRYVHCDISSEEDIARALQATVNDFGGLDILFNNAATSGSNAFIEDLTVEEWADADEHILRSVMLGCKHASPHMRRRGGGSIINTSSVAGVVPFTKRGPAYGTMKAAVLQLTRYLANELAPHRIRVNSIIPGFIMTPIQGTAVGASREVANLMFTEGLYEPAFQRLQPLPEAGRGEHIAEAALFFASDAASWITGTGLPVDGGLLVKYQLGDEVLSALREARDAAEADVRRSGSSRSAKLPRP